LSFLIEYVDCRAGARHHSLLHAAESATSAAADSTCLSVCLSALFIATPTDRRFTSVRRHLGQTPSDLCQELLDADTHGSKCFQSATGKKSCVPLSELYLFLFLTAQPTDNTVFSGRAFSSTAPRIWNSLLITIRTASTTNTFRRHLKTHLFSGNTAID